MHTVSNRAPAGADTEPGFFMTFKNASMLALNAAIVFFMVAITQVHEYISLYFTLVILVVAACLYWLLLDLFVKDLVTKRINHGLVRYTHALILVALCYSFMVLFPNNNAIQMFAFLAGMVAYFLSPMLVYWSWAHTSVFVTTVQVCAVIGLVLALMFVPPGKLIDGKYNTSYKFIGFASNISVTRAPPLQGPLNFSQVHKRWQIDASYKVGINLASVSAAQWAALKDGVNVPKSVLVMKGDVRKRVWRYLQEFFGRNIAVFVNSVSYTPQTLVWR